MEDCVEACVVLAGRPASAYSMAVYGGLCMAVYGGLCMEDCVWRAVYGGLCMEDCVEVCVWRTVYGGLC